MDALYHAIGGAILLALIALLILFTPLWFAAATVVGLKIFLRELTQEQAKHYDFKFFKGWAFWAWSLKKNAETWPPIAAVYLIAWLGAHLI